MISPKFCTSKLNASRKCQNTLSCNVYSFFVFLVFNLNFNKFWETMWCSRLLAMVVPGQHQYGMVILVKYSIYYYLLLRNLCSDKFGTCLPSPWLTLIYSVTPWLGNHVSHNKLTHIAKLNSHLDSLEKSINNGFTLN